MLHTQLASCRYKLLTLYNTTGSLVEYYNVFGHDRSVSALKQRNAFAGEDTSAHAYLITIL